MVQTNTGLQSNNNNTSNEPRHDCDKCHQQNPLDDHSYNAAPSAGDSGNCSNCCAKDQVILQLKKDIKALEIAICHTACKTEKQKYVIGIFGVFCKSIPQQVKYALCNFLNLKQRKCGTGRVLRAVSSLEPKEN